jgi:nitroimidazol reductase NimA-like FMN-containing flavoprotein (pyridoxamine 5'-phosphate oxidase superfamily)
MAEPAGHTRHLEALTIDECFDLLREQVVGRLAIAAPNGPPFVAPVTFVLDGTTVVFRSDPGEKLDAVDQYVSFQVDGFDHLHRTGWSVLVQGRIEIADDADVADVELEPWIGARSYWVRLVPEVVTGRRLVLTLPDLDARGYR